jgi:predicted RNA-binding Zn ribbon-like protein
MQALGDCLSGAVTRSDLAVLRHLRAEFTTIFTAAASGDASTAMDRMNVLLLQFPVHPELVSHDDQRWHVHLARHGSVADRLGAGAVIGIALTVSQVGVSRLGVCGIAACGRVFIDASPGKSRRYCVEHAPARGNVSTLRQRPRSLDQSGAARGAGSADPGRATPAAS